MHSIDRKRFEAAIKKMGADGYLVHSHGDYYDFEPDVIAGAAPPEGHTCPHDWLLRVTVDVEQGSVYLGSLCAPAGEDFDTAAAPSDSAIRKTHLELFHLVRQAILESAATYEQKSLYASRMPTETATYEEILCHRTPPVPEAPPAEERLSAKDYQNALDVQDACNLSGLIGSWHRAMEKVWAEARAVGKGTEFVNRHPICRLFVEQACHLCGAGFPSNSETYHEAYRECLRMAKADTLVDDEEEASPR